MNIVARFTGLLLMLLIAERSFAAEDAQTNTLLRVDNPWVRAVVKGQKVTGAFMTLRAQQALTLLAVRSPVAGSAEVHEMKVDKGVMTMRELPALPLPANEAVELVPGGYHLMLFDLKRQLTAGQQVTLTLTVADGQKRKHDITVRALVKALTHDDHNHGH